MATKPRRLALAMLVGAAVLASAAAWAAIPGGDGTITACYQTNNGQLRAVDSASACRHPEKALTWNQKGAAGPTGPQGPVGPAGITRMLWGTKTATAATTQLASTVPSPTLATLDLPAGAWLVTATIEITSAGAGDDHQAFCTLRAETEENAGRSGKSTANMFGGASASMTIHVGRTFAAPGQAVVACNDTLAQPAGWTRITITAVEGTSVAARALG